jgi:hypothetical protein
MNKSNWHKISQEHLNTGVYRDNDENNGHKCHTNHKGDWCTRT